MGASTDDPTLELAGAFDEYGVRLHGSAESLRQLATYLRTGFSGAILLTAELVERPSANGWWTSSATSTDLTVLTIQVAADPTAPFDFQTEDGVLSIAGGPRALLVLAGSVDNLASDAVLDGPVDRHMSFAYVPEDRWQSPVSEELSVYHVDRDRLRRRLAP